MRPRLLALVLVFVAWTAPALAAAPDTVLSDPALETRARTVGKQLRCLVCQNESIDESDADLARDLRALVRQRIKKGDTNQQVIDYIQSRYGDFVLLKPPFKLKTYALWFGPGVILLLGVTGLVLFYRRRRQAAAAGEGVPSPLSDAERAKLDALLHEDDA